MRKLHIIIALFMLASVGQARDLDHDFSFVSLDGRTIDFKSLAGAPLVMIVGAAWCPQCRAEAPHIQKAYEAYQGKGVVFIGVFGNSKDEEIKEFIENYKLAFPVGKDIGIVKAFGVRAIPQTFFFDRNGRCIRRIIGAASYEEISEYVEKMIEK